MLDDSCKTTLFRKDLACRETDREIHVLVNVRLHSAWDGVQFRILKYWRESDIFMCGLEISIPKAGLKIREK
jgi:hypothetical protein